MASTSNSPLRSRTFAHLAAAYTLNEFGDWIGDVALAVLVFDGTGSPLATAALFLSLRFLPAAVGPLLTSRLEVLEPRRVVPTVQLIEGAIFLVIAVSARNFSLAMILVLAAADGILSIVAKALVGGCTAALLLPHDALRQGNAVLNIGFAAAGALGPALAGLLVAGLGPGSALAVDAATFVMGAFIIATAPHLRIDSDRQIDALGRLRAGLHEAWRRIAVRRLLIAQAVALIFFSAAVPIEVVYAKRTLDAGDGGYGVLMAAWGFGMIVGGLVYARAESVRLLVVVGIATALVGVAYGGLAVAPNLLIACLFSAVGGIGNGAQWIAFTTAVQQAVSDSVQSSMWALLGSINAVMPAVGFLLGGVVTALASPRAAYAVGALGVALVLVAAALRPPLGLDHAAAGPAAPEKLTGTGIPS